MRPLQLLCALASLALGCDGSSSTPSDSPAEKAAPAASNKAADGKAKPEPKGNSATDTTIDEAAAALSEVGPEQRSVFAAAALADVYKDKLPASMIEGLDGIARVSADQRSLIIARSLVEPESLALFGKACGAEPSAVMIKMAELAPSEKVKHLWSACDFAKYGLIDETKAMQSAPMALVIGHAVIEGLGGKDALGPGDRTLITALLESPAGR